MKKKIIAYSMLAIMIATLTVYLTGCASVERSCKSCNSEITGGLYRIVNVYTYEGEIIATYEGILDVQENDTKVLFDLNGKRYVYYNAIVEVIEK